MASWKNEHVLTAYELARGGFTQNQIAKTLGVDPATLARWKTKYPLLKHAIRRGHNLKTGNMPGKFTFRDYVYQRLPDHLKTVWDELVKLDNGKTALSKIETLLQKHGKVGRQHLFLHALTAGNFSLSSACRRVNISRDTFRNWCENDPEFAELINALDEIKGDFFEGSLCQLIAGGDSAATIFANRTFNAKRGYSEKMKVETEVTHTEVNVVNIENLQLTVEEQRHLLGKIRDARKRVESKVI